MSEVMVNRGEAKRLIEAGVKVTARYSAVIGQWPRASRINGTAVFYNGGVETDNGWRKWVGGAALFGASSGNICFYVDEADVPEFVLNRQEKWEKAVQKEREAFSRWNEDKTTENYKAYRLAVDEKAATPTQWD